jgi:uncharacterized protein
MTQPGPAPGGDEAVVAATRNWLEKAVIGLRLCPFAAEAHRGQRIRYRVSAETSGPGLLEELCRELELLRDTDPQQCETTLLIHPQALLDFHDYNDFLDEADAAVLGLGLEGELQVASFHPRYQFAGTAADDIDNYTNRSPFPMLHLLREASIERAVAGFAGAGEIGARNVETLRRLGHAGWGRLWLQETEKP